MIERIAVAEYKSYCVRCVDISLAKSFGGDEILSLAVDLSSIQARRFPAWTHKHSGAAVRKRKPKCDSSRDVSAVLLKRLPADSKRDSISRKAILVPSSLATHALSMRRASEEETENVALRECVGSRRATERIRWGERGGTKEQDEARGRAGSSSWIHESQCGAAPRTVRRKSFRSLIKLRPRAARAGETLVVPDCRVPETDKRLHGIGLEFWNSNGPAKCFSLIHRQLEIAMRQKQLRKKRKYIDRNTNA